MNPFISLFEDPVAALTTAAYAVLLLALLVLSVYALVRNTLTLYDQYDRGGWLLPPFEWTVRLAGGLVILAIDLLVCGALIHILT